MKHIYKFWKKFEDGDYLERRKLIETLPAVKDYDYSILHSYLEDLLQYMKDKHND